jgi:hypothetical protein
MTAPAIDDQLVVDVMRKYTAIFAMRFSAVTIEVHFTHNGLPPLPAGVSRPAPTEVFGAKIKVRNTHLIGIHERLKPVAKLSTFFHEYGHAEYREQSGKDDSNEPELVFSEANAMISSLRLADDEGLKEVAAASVEVIRGVVKVGDYYQKAFDLISRDPLWLKYAQPTGHT